VPDFVAEGVCDAPDLLVVAVEPDCDFAGVFDVDEEVVWAAHNAAAIMTVKATRNMRISPLLKASKSMLTQPFPAASRGSQHKPP
jgi:hypothetical protein